jgi:two-component system sensor histidine kinase and response regulator WspE
MSSFSMLELFGIEVETQAGILKDKLLALETNPEATKELESLMRAAHSIQGAARIVEVDAAIKVARVMEDCFVAAQSGTIALAAEQINVLLQGVDLLLRIAFVSQTEIDDAEIETLVAAISAIQVPGTVTTRQTATIAAPPPPASKTPVQAQKPLLVQEDLSSSSMLELFRTEVETQTAILNDKLLALESNPNATKELESLMRAAHSIKGAARVVQLDAAVKAAHVMEDVFVAAQSGTIALAAEQIDVLLQGVDLLRSIAQVSPSEMSNWLTERDAEIEILVAAISTILVPGSTIGKEQPSRSVETHPSPSEQLAIKTPVVAKNPLPAPEDLPVPVQATPQENHSRVVRVSAENLNRLMGLAGESLVAANGLQPFADSLLQLRKKQVDLSNLLEKLQEAIGVDRLNQHSEIIRSARQKANECRQVLNDRLSELELFAGRSANLSDRLYREVIASHMRPFADGVQGFPRMVRDLSRKLGKQVKFEILGKTTPVDRDILEKLEAPLTHILRNAIDHGIEFPQERLAKGKPAEGTVQLEAVHRAGMLSITVSDDGRGVDLDRLRQKIVTKQTIAAEMAAQLTESELMEFLFLPGFSTASSVTEISGRGVGLDVVHSMVQEVGGVLRAVSKPGFGMSFHLQLPLTLSVIRTLLVEIAGEPYAVPLTRIERLAMISKADIAVVENRQYFTLDDQNIGLVAAYQVLELDASPLNFEALPTIVISDRVSRYGLVVDRFVGERDFVVRPLDPRLGKVPDISAAALMEDGSPVLILDVDDMVRSIDNLLTGGKLSVGVGLSPTPKDSLKKRQRILVVDDSITVREMERKLLENKGYEVEVAVDGIDGWNAVRTGHYDLVISDIDMPRMNGFELVSQIRNNPTLKSLPVIIVSYKDNEEHRLQGLEVGASYYLTKSSIHDNTLLQAVIELIGD